MKERDIVKRIKDFMVREYGATCHKVHTSAYGEIGHCDLWGVLPGGTAYCWEVKQPGCTATPAQLAFLEREKANGALVGVVTSVADVERILSTTSA